MSRDINPFGVRIPPELKAELDKEAKRNGRSLNSEIVDRLKKSFEEVVATHDYTVAQGTPGYGGRILTDIERQILTHFQKLTPEKQLALLSLLK